MLLTPPHALSCQVPGHMYPLAMYSWPVMPPPPAVVKELGEKRITNFSPVGISLAPELDLDQARTRV